MQKYLMSTILTVGLLTTAIFQAPAAETTQPTGTVPPAPSPVQAEMNAIMKRIVAKLTAKMKEEQTDPKEAGKSVGESIAKFAAKHKLTAADLADEFKDLDALLAKHAGEKTEELARVAITKASVYARVLNDEATAEKLTQQWKVDYKGTKAVEQFEKMEAARAAAKKAEAAFAPGLPFPDFNETDLDGKPLSVGNFKGKVVLVDFWATWCGPCVREIPNVIETYKQYHSQGFEIIGISLDSNREKLDAFLKQHDGMTWPQYFDGKGWQNKVASGYGIQSIPFTVLVGPDGKIIAKGLRDKALGEAVGQALKK